MFLGGRQTQMICTQSLMDLKTNVQEQKNKNNVLDFRNENVLVTVNFHWPTVCFTVLLPSRRQTTRSRFSLQLLEENIWWVFTV